MFTRENDTSGEDFDPVEIGRLASGRAPRQQHQQRPKKTRPGKTPDRQPTTPRRPLAPELPSMAAQVWYDLGNDHGWKFPFDVNYLAHQFAERIERDPFLVKVREHQGEDQMLRLVNKMSECWWREYTNAEVTARNANNFFLHEDWDDVRVYAHTSLRAAYLKAHGKTRPLMSEDEQAEEFGEASKQARKALADLRLHQQAEDILNQPEVEIAPLDETRRERLRSFRQRHGGKK